MALVTVRLSAKQPMTDRRMLACKINSLKAPKPGKSHPWRGWVSIRASQRPADKKRAQFIAEAKQRAKKLNKA